MGRFKHETVFSRNTIIYLTEKYPMGWYVSIPQKSFSGRTKQVRTTERLDWSTRSLRIIPWNLTDVVGHREQLGRRCSHWMNYDAGEVHHPDAEGCVPRSWATVTIRRLQKCFGERSSPKAPPSRGHRGPWTLPQKLSTYGVMWKKRPTNVNPETSLS